MRLVAGDQAEGEIAGAREIPPTNASSLQSRTCIPGPAKPGPAIPDL
jgi:hypothetical protein